MVAHFTWVNDHFMQHLQTRPLCPKRESIKSKLLQRTSCGFPAKMYSARGNKEGEPILLRPLLTLALFLTR